VNQPVVQSLVNPRSPGILPRLYGSTPTPTADQERVRPAGGMQARTAGGVRELEQCRRPGACAGGRRRAGADGQRRAGARVFPGGRDAAGDVTTQKL
jgi:hypothetical protein